MTAYTCMLNKLGGIESDLTVSVVDDDGPQAELGVKGMNLSRSFYLYYHALASPIFLNILAMLYNYFI